MRAAVLQAPNELALATIATPQADASSLDRSFGRADSRVARAVRLKVRSA